MLRSHRLLRDSHKLRVGRAGKAADPATYDAFRDMGRLAALLRALGDDGLVAADALDDLEDRIVGGVMALLGERRDSVAVARSVGDAVLDGKTYVKSLSRQMRVGAAAVGALAVEERVILAFHEIMRRVAMADHRKAPDVPL